jgi:peptide methionine sulfoxide reductase msrA/msrB
MKETAILFVAMAAVLLAGAMVAGAAEKGRTRMKPLSEEERRVIVNKGTERPFTGRFVHHGDKGTYTCRQCGADLFSSDAKFDSGTGWPSFDGALPGAVKEIPDPDGRRTEIVCAACGGHLGHVFRGEGFTGQDTRHCVNSISLDFSAAAPSTRVAYFAGGCFWGVEYLMEQEPGVLDAVSGYMGGHLPNPTYEQVCKADTGHAETVKVVFDPAKTSFEQLARTFFEIHDPTQRNRQGPDVGAQYRSAIFFADDGQKQTAERLMEELRKKGLDVATRLQPAGTFWPAEDYHQNYYGENGKKPYCHARTKRF